MSPSREHSAVPAANAANASKIAAWFAACRPKTLAAACAPVAIGTAVGHSVNAVAAATTSTAGTDVIGVHWERAAAALAFALFVQIACNLANDAGDFLRGADTPRRLGPARMAATGALSVRELRIGIALCALAALAVGLPLAAACGWWLLPVGLVSIVAALAYTNGPFPLAYKGLGDVFVLVFFGFVGVLFSAFLQCASFPPIAWVSGFACGLLAVNILLVNNARDMETDIAANKCTTVVRFGRGFARAFFTFNIFAAFLLPPFFSRHGIAPLLLLPFGILLARAFCKVTETELQRYNPLLGKTALLLLAHAALYSAAFLLRLGESCTLPFFCP